MYWCLLYGSLSLAILVLFRVDQVDSLSPSLVSSLDESDIKRIRAAVKLPSTLSETSLSNIYYSVHAQLALSPSEYIKDAAVICKHLQSTIDDDLENIYFGTATAKLLGKDCQLVASKYQSKLDSFLTADSSVTDLFRASTSLLNLGRPLDAKVSKLLVDALKKDESLLNTGMAFQLASRFSKPDERNAFADKIGDVIVQADEVDGKFLQFEGGLGITANLILGVYQLATVGNKPTVGLTNDQALKFANYFLSRKFVLTLKGISELLEVLKLFSNNKYHIPVVISNADSIAITPSNQILTVRITNVLGKSLGAMSVVADSATRLADKKVIWTKKSLVAVQGDSTLFALNFLDSKPPRGFFDIAITATPTKADPRLIGNVGAKVKAIVSTQVEIANAEIGIGDRESGSSEKITKLEFPKSLSTQLEADYHQRLILKFQLRDKANDEFLTAHQTFVQFTNVATKQEIVFIAESDAQSVYKMEVNLLTKAKDLNYLSGVYQLTLIVGDAVISNPIEWKLGSVDLKLPANPSGASPSESSDDGPTSSSLYKARPEIKHLFREPEKRPPSVVSHTFSILALIPLVILFGLWIKLGVNISSFPLSISALVFHLGLALIFLLYVCFFIKLNMFETCKYLSGIGLVTFLAGHSLLSRIANSKNK